MNSVLMKYAALGLLLSTTQIGATGAYLTDMEISHNNKLAAGYWEDNTLRPGDVVINEIMWMGSSQGSSDEWIELHNTTGREITLDGWEITAAKAGNNSLPLSGRIPPNGYYLAAHYTTGASAINDDIAVDLVNAGISLRDDPPEQLILRTGSGTVIDSTPAGDVWAAGSKTGARRSMERAAEPGDGTNPSQWSTCESAACASNVYWDAEGVNYGTPKGANNYDAALRMLGEADAGIEAPPESSSISGDVGDDIPSPAPSPEPDPSATPSPSLAPSPEASPTVTPEPEISPEASVDPEPEEVADTL